LKRVTPHQPAETRRPRPQRHRIAIRLFLIGEHVIGREGLRFLFAAEPGFRVVGSASDWTAGARAFRPDVILVDLSTPRMPDKSALRALTTLCAPARVIFLAPECDRDRPQIAGALRVGVRGIVAKSVTAQLLCKSIRAVAAGQYWVGTEIVSDFTMSAGAAVASNPDAPRKPFSLTERELQVVSLLIAGYGNKAIADKCGIRERTVKQHLTNMFAKLGVSSRLELALLALHERLVVPDSGSDPARMLQL
jgi:DNA-binding NarL/FixJ family response regulator